jgi:Tol biopolymer transport system component
VSGHLYITGANGSGRTRLLQDEEALWNLASCGPGDAVVFDRLSQDNTPNVWQLNVGTGELKRLTSGKNDEGPSCTPDGKFVVYYAEPGPGEGAPHIYKISVDGGTPVELDHGNIQDQAVSPDGSAVAYVKVEGQGASAKSKLVIRKLESGAQLQEIDAPGDNGSLGWTPDGHALTYLHTVGSARHLYMQPLGGGPPIQLTHFDTEPSWVAAYAWTRDGKKVAITRARYNDTDVVMFSGFR